MRILVLNDRIPPENRGGAGEVVWRLALGLQQAGHEVHVAAATPGAPFEAVRDGIPTYHLHSRYPERFRAYLSLYNPQTAGALRSLYERIQPDVINAHNIHADLSYHSLTLAHRLSIPAVFSSHDVMPFAYFKMSYCIDPALAGVRSPNDYRLPPLFNLKTMRLRYNPLRNWAIRRILRQHTQARTTPSHELSRAHAANGLPPFEVVHNGIDGAQFAASPVAIEALRDRLNLRGRQVILFAGRLTADKGTVPLLKALAEVVKTVPEAALLVLSSHPLEDQVQQPEFAHLREKHLVSGGWLAGEDLAAAFHLADVVTVPSIIFDTFPTVNLEAMAAGKPVLATCYGGSREAVEDSVTGYIINPFDTADFAAKLTRLLTDNALRVKMGAAGLERVQSQFSLKRQVGDMVVVFERARSNFH
jgi:glycosyltransferase involved in cell wall biosynthesis